MTFVVIGTEELILTGDVEHCWLNNAVVYTSGTDYVLSTLVLYIQGLHWPVSIIPVYSEKHIIQAFEILKFMQVSQSKYNFDQNLWSLSQWKCI